MQDFQIGDLVNGAWFCKLSQNTQSRLWRQVSIKLTFIPLQDLLKHGMIFLSSLKFTFISFVASRWLRALAIQQLLLSNRNK